MDENPSEILLSGLRNFPKLRLKTGLNNVYRSRDMSDVSCRSAGILYYQHFGNKETSDDDVHHHRGGRTAALVREREAGPKN